MKDVYLLIGQVSHRGDDEFGFTIVDIEESDEDARTARRQRLADNANQGTKVNDIRILRCVEIIDHD